MTKNMADDSSSKTEEYGPEPPPPQFQRMLSWQLSQVVDYTETVKKKKKKKQKDSTNESLNLPLEDQLPLLQDISVSRVKKDGYTVTNSDGEDEVFYSAPQSPELTSSSDDEETDRLATESLTSLSTTPGPLEDNDLLLMEKEYQMKESSKKTRRKHRRVANKMARAEFFQPLCNLIEDKMQLDVDDLDLKNYSTVPSLCELCLRKIKKSIKKNEDTDLPYLVTSLVSSNQGERETISRHVQWIEKWLAYIELKNKEKKISKKKKKGKCLIKEHVYPAYQLQRIFSHDFRPITRSEIGFGDGLHVPLPYVLPPTFHNFIITDPPSLLLFVHYANYFYPLMVDDWLNSKKDGKHSKSESGLTSAQKTAIYRVNHWIEQRYPSLSSKMCKEELKLWPGYVHWARGNMQLAAEAFARAFDELTENVDKIVLLNEMARMFVYFNERGLAASHYNKSSNIPLLDSDRQYEPLCDLCMPMTLPCNFALQASVWDTGPIDMRSAIMARKSWDHVIKCCDDTDNYPADVWCLHVAAVESKIFVHAGQPVEVVTPDQPRDSLLISPYDTIMKWAAECEAIIRSNTTLLTRHPILYYHLSLILAIKGDILKSRRAFDSYLDNFAGFGEWDDGILPGSQFYRHIIRSRRPHPWKNLFDLLPQNHPPPRIVPILPLHWRVRLLHPLYPYISSELDGSVLADHSPCGVKDINLRLTSDGYLTGDMQMDLPPMKTVLIDPYTGDLCYPRRTGLQHCYYSNEHANHETKIISSLPWPLRVYETNDCVVELLMMFKPNNYDCYKSCSMCVLDRYSSDGSHHRIDLRKIVRRERKKAILETCKFRGVDDLKALEEQMDIAFNKGLCLTYQTLLVNIKANVPTTGNKSNKKKQKKTYKTFTDQTFLMFLQSHMILGDGTVRLMFSLHTHTQFKASVVVFINCNSSKEFLKPRVYVTAEEDEIIHFYPSVESSLPYHQYHLKHVRHSSVVTSRFKTHKEYENTQVFFDNKGDIIARRRFNDTRRSGAPMSDDLVAAKAHIMGERCYQMDGDTKCVKSWSLFDHTATHQSSPFFNVRNPDEFEDSFKTVSGLILVECPNGVVILHPGTLERLNIEGSDDSLDPPPQDGMVHPQFVAPDAKVHILSVLDIKDIEEVTKMGDSGDSNGLNSAIFTSFSRGTSTVEQSQDDNDTSSDDTASAGDTSGCGLYVEVEMIDEVNNDDNFLLPDDLTDYGSGCIALSVNDRLLVLECLPRTEKVSIKLDVKLPGRPLDFHIMKGYGFLVTATQFPDTFRSDLYWLSPQGHLLGMLPCLGAYPRSLFSVALPPRTGEESMGSSTHKDGSTAAQDGGTHVFFDDGVGSLCCLRLKDTLNPYQ